MEWNSFFTEFIEHVKKKPELDGLPDDFVKRAWETASKRNPVNSLRLKEAVCLAANYQRASKNSEYALIFKEMRALLRKQHGMFNAKEQKDRKSRTSLLAQLHSLNEQKMQKSELQERQKEIFRKLLLTHPSTAERARDYETVCAKWFEFAKADAKKRAERRKISILDLGAGLNIASCAFWTAHGKITYMGYDISSDDADLINEICKEINSRDSFEITGKGAVFDLGCLAEKKGEDEFLRKIIDDSRSIHARIPYELCLLLKTADVLEKQRRGSVRKLLSFLLCGSNGKMITSRVIVSFATRSLGQGKDFRKTRPWFESILKHENLGHSKFSTENELFYLIGHPSGKQDKPV